MRIWQNLIGLTVVVALVGFAACSDTGTDSHGHSGDGDHAKAHEAMWKDVTRAVAVVVPTDGNNVTGTFTFEQQDGGVRVSGSVTGLTPGQKHGFHIHEFGDLTSADGTAQGGHYNPEGHDHALPNGEARHAGDLGNLEANDAGEASFDMTFDNITIAGMKNPIIGRGLIIHAQPDDGGQPTGNAGARIGQGVIGIAKQ